MAASVVWYKTGEEWLAMKEIAADPDVWEENFDEWKDHAEQVIGNLRDNGQYVKPVSFKVDGYRAWCDSNEYPYDAASRSKYAAYVAEIGEYHG